MSLPIFTGHDSSVLVQAFYNQIPTYRIQEISMLDIDDVPMKSFGELISLEDHVHSTYDKQDSNVYYDLNQVATKIVFELRGPT